MMKTEKNYVPTVYCKIQWTSNPMVKIKSKKLSIKKLTDETFLTNGAKQEGLKR